MPEHGLLHQGVARANRDAVSTRNAARLADRRAAIPQYPRMRVLPTDGQSFVHLEILASFDATAAQDALIRIVTVERIAVVNLVRLRLRNG